VRCGAQGTVRSSLHYQACLLSCRLLRHPLAHLCLLYGSIVLFRSCLDFSRARAGLAGIRTPLLLFLLTPRPLSRPRSHLQLALLLFLLSPMWLHRLFLHLPHRLLLPRSADLATSAMWSRLGRSATRRCWFVRSCCYRCSWHGDCGRYADPGAGRGH
jgi:hypothetical protein